MKTAGAFCCILIVVAVAGASATRSMLDLEAASSNIETLERRGATALYEGSQCTVYGGSVQCSSSKPNVACCSDASADALCNTYGGATVNCGDDPDGYQYVSCCQYTDSDVDQCQEADDSSDYCDDSEDYPVDSCLPDDGDTAFPKADTSETCPDGTTFYCCKDSSSD